MNTEQYIQVVIIFLLMAVSAAIYFLKRFSVLRKAIIWLTAVIIFISLNCLIYSFIVFFTGFDFQFGFSISILILISFILFLAAALNLYTFKKIKVLTNKLKSK